MLWATAVSGECRTWSRTGPYTAAHGWKQCTAVQGHPRIPARGRVRSWQDMSLTHKADVREEVNARGWLTTLAGYELCAHKLFTWVHGAWLAVRCSARQMGV